MGSGGGGSKSETIYNPGKKTITQSYEPLYIQEARAEQANVSGINLVKAREAYADAVAKASILPGAGLPQIDPKFKEREFFDAKAYLPSKEFLEKGYGIAQKEIKTADRISDLEKQVANLEKANIGNPYARGIRPFEVKSSKNWNI